MLAMAGTDMTKASHKVLNEVARRIKRTKRNKRSKRSNWPAKSKSEPAGGKGRQTMRESLHVCKVMRNAKENCKKYRTGACGMAVQHNAPI